jgi:hypothetical protein
MSGKRLVLVLVTSLGLISSCASNSTVRPSTDSDLVALATKVPLLQADICYTNDPAKVYPLCGKFVTELGSTVGVMRVQLAQRDAALAQEVTLLQTGIDQYQKNSCESAGNSPSSTQISLCPKAIQEIQQSIGSLRTTLTKLVPVSQ